jgi:transcriptional regulator with XRE-family HTH domain|nr:MAG TPA_asm: helix-turn-helix domain protein [Caudoviricetes sp.]DAZ44457.1 MAG TPA: helix-turn-helix domain protein [Caudoviricetes sp.]
MCLGENIRFLRTKKGYSQDDIANKLGYKSFTTIQKWESGVSEPPLKALKKLSEIFNIDMNDLATKKLSTDTSSDNDVYYLDDDARDMAQFMYENPEYKVLFDASRKVKKEDIQFVKEMIDRMSNNND